MPDPTPPAPTGRTLRVLLACLVLLLAILFLRSFSEHQVLFANDAPLGQLKTQEGKGMGNFRGVWIDLNWIGFTQPSALPNISNLLYLVTGPLGYARFYAPVALLVLGLAAGLFFRQLRFSRAACVLGGIAAMLNTDPFSYACWGLPSLTLSMAAIFLALAALVSHPGRFTWTKAALAGLAVGFSITEGFDNGAIFSLYVAAFVLFDALQQPGEVPKRAVRGVLGVAVVAAFAAFMAAQALSTLIGTQIKGIAGTAQDAQTRQARWDMATMGSLPKIETLRVLIPGVYGYRMDTPDGGNYWGTVGQTPGVPQSRHSGAGVYAGVLVTLVALWAFARSLVAANNPYTPGERRRIRFWMAAAVVSLLFAFGRHAPFYQFLYALPYFSTIRMPYKFMHPFTVCWVTLFAYGVEGLWRQFVTRNAVTASSPATQIRNWWAKAAPFDRKWTLFSGALLVAAVLGWLIYGSARTELVRHLQSVGFDAELAAAIARFSVTEVGWFLLFLALGLGALVVIQSGMVSGARARWATVLLGFVLVTDLLRANSPWVVYYDYREKYAANPVIDLLRQNPHEHRVAGRLAPQSPASLAQGQLFPTLYNQDWMQHLFPYYGIQSVDIIQMPRTPELDAAYLTAFTPTTQTNLFPIARLWQLTNTRWQLGMAPFLDLLNQQIDPHQRSFRILTNFDFALRPGRTNGAPAPEDITANLTPQGQYAVFELTSALPRARLFNSWESVSSGEATLARLLDPAFDPSRTVLLSESIPPQPRATVAPGTTTITAYESKRVQIRAQSEAPAVLLLNDKHHPDWKVFIDGQPAPLLRANFIMRAVQVPAGEHTVEFRFMPPMTMLYVSLAALVVAAGLGLRLALARPTASPPTAAA